MMLLRSSVVIEERHSSESATCAEQTATQCLNPVSNFCRSLALVMVSPSISKGFLRFLAGIMGYD